MSEIGICVHNGHLHSAYMTIAFFRIWQPEDNNNFLLCLHYANVYMQFGYLYFYGLEFTGKEA